MSDYSEKQQEEFERLHRGVLRIRKNLETGFYLRKSFGQRSRIVMENAKYIRRYCEEVPSDIKENYSEDEQIDIGKLIEDLYEVKSKL